MNIGIDIKSLGKGKGGIARYLAEILRAISSIDTRNQYFLFEKDNACEIAKAPNFHRISLPSHLPGTIWLQTSVLPHIKKLGIDVFWSPEHIAPVLSNLPIIITVHDLTYNHYPGSLQPTNYWIFKLLFARSLKKASRIIAVSDYTRRDLLQCYPGLSLAHKTSVIYNGSPGWKIPRNYNPENRANHLLFVGSPEPRKNLTNVFAALTLLNNKGLKISLRIVGPPGWKNKRLLSYSNAHNLSDQIVFAGYCEHQKLIDEYIKCKALIFPSLLEGFGLPVLEALESDTLVLTSKDSVMEEIGGKALLTFDPRRPEEIANTIESIYSPDFDRNKYLSFAAETAAKYSWKHAAQKHIEIFKIAGNRALLEGRYFIH